MGGGHGTHTRLRYMTGLYIFASTLTYIFTHTHTHTNTQVCSVPASISPSSSMYRRFGGCKLAPDTLILPTRCRKKINHQECDPSAPYPPPSSPLSLAVSAQCAVWRMWWLSLPVRAVENQWQLIDALHIAQTLFSPPALPPSHTHTHMLREIDTDTSCLCKPFVASTKVSVQSKI